MVKDEAERPIAPDANGLGICPICWATIGGVHLIMLHVGYTAEQIHEEHLAYMKDPRRMLKFL